jgi:hypothetical protein
MAALLNKRLAEFHTIDTMVFPLAGSVKAFEGGAAAWDSTATGAVYPVTAKSNLIEIGQFKESVDNSASTATSFVNVELAREIKCFWYDNGTGTDKVLSSDLGGTAYGLDDHTVSRLSSGKSAVGRIWKVDATKGVLIQPNQF